MNDNIITQPLLPDTIRFFHTIENSKTEVMRITRDGVWVNPDLEVDEVAKAVLNALDSQIKVLIQKAVEDAPPKREWVGLTRLELDIATLNLEDLSDCYKAIEAKLKEKNT